MSFYDPQKSKRVKIHPIDQVDCDTVARDIWDTLNSARAMGLDLSKYGLFPLSLEEGNDPAGILRESRIVELNDP